MKNEIHWVSVLLNRWGRWALRADSGALGYAKCSVLMGAGKGDGVISPAPPPDVTNDDFEDISRSVGNLPHVLKVCVIQVYQLGQGKSDTFNAQALGISRRGLTEYIGQAQRQIARDISVKTREN